MKRIAVCEINVRFETALVMDEVEVPPLRSKHFSDYDFLGRAVELLEGKQLSDARGVASRKREHEIHIVSDSRLSVEHASDAARDHVREPRSLEASGEEKNEVSLGHARRLLSQRPQLDRSTNLGAADVRMPL
jgi:hypothetical protein